MARAVNSDGSQLRRPVEANRETDRREQIADLAREIYARQFGSGVSSSRTPEHVAALAIASAEKFFDTLDRVRLEEEQQKELERLRLDEERREEQRKKEQPAPVPLAS